MKVVAAYLLAVLGGNATPSAQDLKNILASVGAEAEEEKIQLLLAGVKGKDMTELIAMGRERLASVPCGGGGGGGGVISANYNGGDSGSATAVAEEPPQKEEMKEESDEEMCFSLFD